tara:strand:- start:246 stop:1067 length:822 start_codon:yes stop_codon:yes gene_type:complete
MYIKNNKSTLFITKDRNLNSNPMLFIHGFTGSSKSWRIIRDNISIPSLAIDIPGHNKSTFNNLNDDYYFNDFTNELYMSLLSINIKKIHICSYSLGGRLALCFAAKYPDIIQSLFIESSTIGMEPGDEKNICYENDKKISTLIDTNYIKFLEKWEKNYLFTNQEDRNIKAYNEQKTIRLSHNNKQLSHSLKTFSKGNMPFMLHQYQKFNFPITIINGKDDIKYIKEGRIMLKLNNNSKQYIVNNASHNVHLENMESYLDLLNNHINKNIIEDT